MRVLAFLSAFFMAICSGGPAQAAGLNPAFINCLIGGGPEILGGLVQKKKITQGKDAVISSARKFYPDKLSGHAAKHQVEVGATSAKQYEAMAVEFAQSKDPNMYTGLNKRGEWIKLDAKTGRYLVVEKSGMIKTFFVPNDPKIGTPLDYFVNELKP